MVERTRSGSQAGGAAWARVQREISAVAGKTPRQVQRWWFRRAAALLSYHAQQSRNPAYGELLDNAGAPA